MNARQLFVLAVFIFGIIYTALTLGFGLFVVDWSSLLGIIIFLGFELLLIGVAYDITEIFISTIFKPQELPRVFPLKKLPPVALVMTVCDDICSTAIEQLGKQDYLNCDFYILDDSVDHKSSAALHQFAYPVIRRGTRKGFKAGNLNYWLKGFGKKYKYLIVFDSDSIADEDFVTRMVEYGEHPDNEDVALFQSNVIPWNRHHKFERILGAMAPARFHVLKRTADRMGTLFSFGHNYLVRTKCIMEVGGFPENVSAEDTALTLLFSMVGYSTRLVDVVSYDAEPRNAFLYARRTIRWAKQTAEMFRFPWTGASTRLKLMLCHHLYSYSINAAYLMLLLLSSWAFSSEKWNMREIVRYIIATSLYTSPGFVLIFFVSILWVIQWSLRAILAKHAGVRFRDVLLHNFMLPPLTFSFVFRMSYEMVRIALGDKVVFDATNSKMSVPPAQSLIGFIKYMILPLIYSVVTLAGVVLRNRFLLYGPNGLWILLLFAAPLILWLFHHKSRAGDEY